MKKRIKVVTDKYGDTLYFPEVLEVKKTLFSKNKYYWTPIRTCKEYWDPKHPHGCGTLEKAREYADKYQGKTTVKIIDV